MATFTRQKDLVLTRTPSIPSAYNYSMSMHISGDRDAESADVCASGRVRVAELEHGAIDAALEHRCRTSGVRAAEHHVGDRGSCARGDKADDEGDHEGCSVAAEKAEDGARMRRGNHREQLERSRGERSSLGAQG
jgi:hypothetical protein